MNNIVVRNANPGLINPGWLIFRTHYILRFQEHLEHRHNTDKQWNRNLLCASISIVILYTYTQTHTIYNIYIHTLPYHAMSYHAMPCHIIPYHTMPYTYVRMCIVHMFTVHSFSSRNALEAQDGQAGQCRHRPHGYPDGGWLSDVGKVCGLT